MQLLRNKRRRVRQQQEAITISRAGGTMACRVIHLVGTTVTCLDQNWDLRVEGFLKGIGVTEKQSLMETRREVEGKEQKEPDFSSPAKFWPGPA